MRTYFVCMKIERIHAYLDTGRKINQKEAFNENKIKGKYHYSKSKEKSYLGKQATIILYDPVYSVDVKYIQNFREHFWSGTMLESIVYSDLYKFLESFSRQNNLVFSLYNKYIGNKVTKEKARFWLELDTSQKLATVSAEFSDNGRKVIVNDQEDTGKLIELLQKKDILPLITPEDAIKELSKVGIKVKNGQISKKDLDKAINLLSRVTS